METATVVKTVGMGIGGAGVVGATGYGAYSLIKPKTIEEQLKWDGFDLLDTEGSEDDTTWTSRASSYPNSKNKFPDLASIAENNGQKKDKLKSKCKEELKKKLEEDTNESVFKAAKDWCTKEKTTATSP